jgi:hypothetical protein
MGKAGMSADQCMVNSHPTPASGAMIPKTKASALVAMTHYPCKDPINHVVGRWFLLGKGPLGACALLHRSAMGS